MIVRKSATLTEIKGKYAILTLEGGQTLELPHEDLEPTVSTGTAFTIQILPEAEAAMEKDELARTLLNQILEHDEKEGSRSATGSHAN